MESDVLSMLMSLQFLNTPCLMNKEIIKPEGLKSNQEAIARCRASGFTYLSLIMMHGCTSPAG